MELIAKKQGNLIDARKRLCMMPHLQRGGRAITKEVENTDLFYDFVFS